MRVVVITPPGPVVTPEEIEAHLKLDDLEAERDYIEALIAAATATIDGPDGWLGRAIGVQTLEARADVFRDCMHLPFPPIIDVVSVKYLDVSGAETTVLASDYELRGNLIGASFGKRWPSVLAYPESVRMRYRAGYEAVPAPILAAIKLMVGDLYRFRETVSEQQTPATVPMSTTVENLLGRFRVYR